MTESAIISPDTQRENRVPPGQHLTERWPVLHYGPVPRIDPAKWTLSIFGSVVQATELSHAQFVALPQVQVFADIHCVTTWSRLDNTWKGISTSALKDLVTVRPEAKFVIVHAAAGFTTNLTVDDFFAPDALFALQHDGQPLTPEHGGPVRLVVRHRRRVLSARQARILGDAGIPQPRRPMDRRAIQLVAVTQQN